MPELSEIKIMADFINAVTNEEKFFCAVEKSAVSKVKTELDPFGGAVFTLNAESRGKELMLHLEMIGGDINGNSKKNLLCTMGMSGNWVYIRKDAPQLEQAFKHGHLRIQSTRGNWLIMHDVRRFAKWRWSEDWGKGRGPCPLAEFNDWQLLIQQNWYTHKHFNTPLHLVLMNQGFFNGVGNYIRAEVLWRLGVNPFAPANSLPLEKLQELLKVVHLCFRDSYALGGGQLKDWHNPHGTDGASFNAWIKCYGKPGMSKIKDKLGRTFWFDPQWNKEAEEHLAA